MRLHCLPVRWPPTALARATASLFTCPWCRKRWSPCLPVPALAPFTQLSSAASPRTNWRPASTMRDQRPLFPLPVASNLQRSFPTSHCSTRQSSWLRMLPKPASFCSGHRNALPWNRAATSIGTMLSVLPVHITASFSMQPTPCTYFTRPARQESPKESYATMADTRSRCTGR